MKNKPGPLAVVCLVFCLLSLSIPFGAPAAASPMVSLHIDRRFGYALFSDIAGALTIVATASPDVIRVEFYLDGQLKLNDTATPFEWDFDTPKYALGPHLFEATAHNSAGQSAHASETANFVEAPFPPYYGAFLALTIGAPIVLALVFRVISLSRKREKQEE